MTPTIHTQGIPESASALEGLLSEEILAQEALLEEIIEGTSPALEAKDKKKKNDKKKDKKKKAKSKKKAKDKKKGKKKGKKKKK